MDKPTKPLGIKNYGSIPHIPGSRVGPGDHHCTPGQLRIVTEKTRDKHDLIICTEKLDGSNVGIALTPDNKLVTLGRAGYACETSEYLQHQVFDRWVQQQADRFLTILHPGWRIVGEWLMQAHGTKYELHHEPFVVFDMFNKSNERIVYEDLVDRARAASLAMPMVLHHDRAPVSLSAALLRLGDYGHHGARDLAEGVVWRVERSGKVDFLCKYVRPDKIDGKYFPQVSGEPEQYNITASALLYGK